MSTTEIPVAILHSVPLVRFGLAHTLPQIQLVAEGSDLDDIVGQSQRTSVVISDVTTPTRTAFELIVAVRALGLDRKILFLSGVDDSEVIASIMAAGANGYALLSQPLEDIATAIALVHRGARYVPTDVPGLGALSFNALQLLNRLARLTSREREVFALMLRGASAKEIAEHLFISPRTAETHRYRITAKLGVDSLTRLIRRPALYVLIEARIFVHDRRRAAAEIYKESMRSSMAPLGVLPSASVPTGRL